MNGGTRLSYYNFTIEVKILQIYFVVSVFLHLDANLFYIICLLIYIYYIYIFFLCIYSFIYLFIYLYIYLIFRYINLIFL